jgi:hypothetical protein
MLNQWQKLETTVFNEREEKDFVDHLTYMAKIGYGYSKNSIQSMAKQYAMSL